MHMADALLTPAVGGAFWGVTAATIAYCSRKLKTQADEGATALMGVLGAFVFAAQMINFSIPVTGSSGHLGGGLLLALLLGPQAAFLTMASILTVQALFFADGGLLALGCNIFNLGFIPALLVYPLLLRPLLGANPSRRRLTWSTLFGAVVAMQLGSLAVVTQTALSGISALPATSFLLVMQPIHLAIGLVEGVVTALTLNLLRQQNPQIVSRQLHTTETGRPLGRVAGVFLLLTLLVGGGLSWYASAAPDGLEWSIERIAGENALSTDGGSVVAFLETFQQATSFLPDYSLGETDTASESLWFQRFGTSLSGLLGAAMLLVIGWLGSKVFRTER